MQKMFLSMVLILVVAGGFFNSGCTMLKPVGEEIGAGIVVGGEKAVQERLDKIGKQLEEQGVVLEQIQTLSGATAEATKRVGGGDYMGAGAVGLYYTLWQVMKYWNNKKKAVEVKKQG